MATESTLTTAVKENSSTAISAPKPEPVAAPVKIKKGSSLADRLWAFFVGVGVGGIAFYYKLSEDITESTAEVVFGSWVGVVGSLQCDCFRCSAFRGGFGPHVVCISRIYVKPSYEPCTFASCDAVVV
jgi:hypothetical protein